MAYTLAKLALEIVPRTVSPDDWAHDNYFEEDHLKTLPLDQVDEAMFRASDERRKIENEDKFIEVFFGPQVRKYLSGKNVLDFGCYFGGAALAWEQMYGINSIKGFDVSPTFIVGANRYAKHIGSSAEFKDGFGENAPFPDQSFDTIVAIDVFEHVHDFQKVLQECERMLVPGGHLITIFPPYWHPYCHHLKVSGTPFVHWVFSADTLREAQNEMLHAKGSAYAHFASKKVPHYRLPSLNGITVREARRLVRQQGWGIVEEKTYGWPRIGRRARTGAFKALGAVNSVLAKLPVLEEIFLDRVAVILKKPEVS